MQRFPRLIRLIARLATANRAVAEFGRRTAAMLLALMLAIVMVQVVFRYLLNDSLVWTEEIAKTLMVWSAFLVAPFAWRRGSNVAIRTLVEPLGPRSSAAIRLALNALVIWVLAVLWVESFGFVSRGWLIDAASLPVPMAVFYTIVPAGLAALLLVGCELVCRDLMGLLDPDGDYAIQPIEPIREGE